MSAPFGSYAAEEITWLMTDLSEVELELSTAEREKFIQSGRNYAEMLPIEYQPDAAYTGLFHAALDASAERLALAVGLVAELVLDRHPEPVVVSLARAGTPIGILVRRWCRYAHGVDVPHYAVSIVRGVGIDEVALAHVLERHPAASVQFVDGWTGKGAIARELAAAVRDHGVPGLDPTLAVLADPGSCTDLYGTRDDFLIPSACLNSTVSGLVSRTVYRRDLIGPGMFHGAKCYRELADQDVSGIFLDRIAAEFPAVEGRVRELLPLHRSADRTPSWSGWSAVARLAEEHGIADLNLVKPGVGETTRVLLRRRPSQVIVRPDRARDLAHVRHLAAARDVPVVERDDLPYSCVGLIAPVGRP